MLVPFSLLLGSLGYLFYKTKKEATLVDDSTREEINIEDELYEDLEDLFI